MIAITDTTQFVAASKSPDLTIKQISGELNDTIEMPVSLTTPEGPFKGMKARLQIFFNLNSDAQGPFSLYLDGKEIQKDSDYSNYYSVDIPSLESKTYSFAIKASEKVMGSYSAFLYPETGGSITGTNEKSIRIPFGELSATDVDALKQLASDNPSNKDLQDLIEKEWYKQNIQEDADYNVGVTWNEETPARIISFFIRDDDKTIRTLNLSPLTALERINIDGTSLDTLDLSALNSLNSVGINCNLTWKQVSTPRNPSGEVEYYGIATIRPNSVTGDQYNCFAASGTLIDLSAYAFAQGDSSTYRWVKIEENPYKETEVTMEAAPGEAKGCFILKGNPSDIYSCEISNPFYKYWSINTCRIKIARDGASYSETDIEGLRQLATANPDAPQLQQFVDKEGWKVENWKNRKDPIRTDWTTSTDGKVRLTHLAITLDWKEDKDSIKTLNLTPFTELKYFECEQFMDISELDLSHNTKLEHLHLYSGSLTQLDLTPCPNLREFIFASLSFDIGSPDQRYQATKLSNVKLENCKKLREITLQDAHITTLNLANFNELKTLNITNCRDLTLQGWETVTTLNHLNLSHTTQFGELVQNLPASVTNLYLQNTSYELPPTNGNLYGLGLPEHITSLDLNNYPQLERLELGYNGSKLTYAGIKNYRSIRYRGESYIQLASSNHPERPDFYEVGDTIDLSAYASFNGKETVFLWVNSRYNIEETELFQPVEGKPGMFILTDADKDSEAYYCILMHTDFCQITDINTLDGWRMITSRIHTDSYKPAPFHEGDVEVLRQIVAASPNCQNLQQWWSTGAWQSNENVYNAQVLWSGETPRRIQELYIYNMDNMCPTIDLSQLDALETVSLTNNNLQELILPANKEKLQSLMVGMNSNLTSLIVSEYANLCHLNVSHTGLTALDLSRNKQLTSLYMQGTSIPGVETMAPETAQQLVEYAVPATMESIDLAAFPALKMLDVQGTQWTYSNIKNPHQLERVFGKGRVEFGSKTGRYTRIGETIDLSAETNGAGEAVATIVWKAHYPLSDTLLIGNDPILVIPDTLISNMTLSAHLTHSLFPGWNIVFNTTLYTRDGDANTDGAVNVQDVVATVNHLLGNNWNQFMFGYGEADVNANNQVDAADLTGIVNLIHGENTTLRAAVDSTVDVETDPSGQLSVNSPAPISSIYLEIKGAQPSTALIGKAARLTQASSLHGDTLRIVAYSLDGKTIPAGKETLLNLPAGARLLAANFGDPQGNCLSARLASQPTHNEEFRPEKAVKAIYNTPNPTTGTTTFCYGLDNEAARVTIRIYASNGALVATLTDLPGQVGENRFTTTLHLPAGLYFYRFEAAGNAAKANETNTLIIR